MRRLDDLWTGFNSDSEGDIGDAKMSTIELLLQRQASPASSTYDKNNFINSHPTITITTFSCLFNQPCFLDLSQV